MLATRLRSALPVPAVALVTLVVTASAGVVIARTLDPTLLRATFMVATDRPVELLLGVAAFGAAFVLRAIAWRRVLPTLSFGHALSGVHLALGANHVLPLRLGEAARPLSVSRRAGVPLDAALSSVGALRAVDMAGIVALGLLTAPTVFTRLLGPIGWAMVVMGLAATVVLLRWLRSVSARRTSVNGLGPAAVLLSLSAWLLEAVLTWRVATWAGLDLSYAGAVLVTTVAIAAQVAAIAPGGFGTYEVAVVAGYVALGHDAHTALAAALAAHAIKTVHALLVGAVAVWRPTPSLIGRLRMPRTDARAVPNATIPDDAPILLFMPAHDEEASIGACIRRVPASAGSRPIDVLVVDDGSSDGTVREARSAGAEVVSFEHNRGLGAAVRKGLQIGADRGAAAVVFCDADGEYPPEEIERLVEPILTGHADFVGGSRFLGRIDHMRPHRRLGNVVLTRILSFIARRRITDGQTGYRAFSAEAAAAAEVIHDYNYAQVLTLDLLAKGFRLAEVPISYRFRTQGDSFIRLGTYLRRVAPAVYREINAPAPS